MGDRDARAVILRHTAQLGEGEARQVRDLLDDAFAGEFGDEDFEHALGGMHALEGVVARAYVLGALSASAAGARLYAGRGWQVWGGEIGVGGGRGGPGGARAGGGGGES
ncbi:hypothetical protein ACFXA9_26805, partial [Streptomyces sp. NPDC059411]